MSLSRRVVAGTTQLTLTNGVVRLLSVVTMPILTGLLSPQAYGVATLVGTIISLVSVIALAGIDMSYARAYHGTESASGSAAEHFCWRYSIGATLFAAALAVIGWQFLETEVAALGGWTGIVIALGIIFSVVHTMANTRARLHSRYGATAWSIIIAGVASVALSIGIAQWWRQDALALLIPMLLSYVIPALMLGMPAFFELARPSILTRRESTGLIKIGVAGVVTAPMYWLLSFSDRWFLEHYQGIEAVGVYAIGYSVAIVGMILNTAIMAVWLPEATREYEDDPARARVTLGRLMGRIIVLMAIVWLAVAAAGGDLVRLLSNERFHAASEFVPYIAGAVFFNGVLHLGNACLLLARQLRWAALWWLAGGVVCIVLNLILVPYYGGLGAAITQTLSFALISLAIVATAWFLIRFRLELARLAAALTVIAAFGVLLIPAWHADALMSLAMKLPVGIVACLVTARLIAPDWCVEGIDALRRIALS